MTSGDVRVAVLSRAGEEREITIPGHEAYGGSGMPAWGIGSDETLKFTVEIVNLIPGARAKGEA